MAVPKKRTSKTKRNMRRSHHARSPVQLTSCPKCKQPVPPHTTCPNCGTYKNRVIFDVMAKLEKKERREKEKELSQQEESSHQHPPENPPAQ
jgi:large subunit ribosomal protein L32